MSTGLPFKDLGKACTPSTMEDSWVPEKWCCAELGEAKRSRKPFSESGRRSTIWDSPKADEAKPKPTKQVDLRSVPVEWCCAERRRKIKNQNPSIWGVEAASRFRDATQESWGATSIGEFVMLSFGTRELPLLLFPGS